MPFTVKASLLSSLFGDTASANIVSSFGTEQAVKNSQTLTLLQASDVSSSLSTVQEKKNKDDKSKQDQVKEGADINVVSDTALQPETNHVSSPTDNLNGDSADQISVYVVRKGDSISQIAEMYDVSVNTILWANDMKKGDKLTEGDVLFILPISGVKHVVAKGETLKSLAKKYGADVSDIASFNDLAENEKLTVGDELIIPDGEISVDAPIKSSPKNYPKYTGSGKNLAGYFVNPVPGAIKTQGLHGKNAVDLAAAIGTPIYASASGTVLLARMGWNGAYGNMVIIQHPNGTKTLYAHLSKLGSSTGQNVSQGEIIGYVGNSGHVRAAKGGNGAHLHFEVYNAKNPGSDGSWKD